MKAPSEAQKEKMAAQLGAAKAKVAAGEKGGFLDVVQVASKILFQYGPAVLAMIEQMISEFNKEDGLKGGKPKAAGR